MTPISETLETFDELVHNGKVRCVGLSNFSRDRAQDVLQAARQAGYRWLVAMQPRYNLVDRDYETSLAAVCAEHGISCFPYYGLAKGFLTGKYRSADAPGDSPNATRARAYATPDGLATLNVLDEVSDECGASMAAVALAWLAGQPTVIAPLAGARSRSQVEELVWFGACDADRGADAPITGSSTVIERRTIVFPHQALGGIEHPAFEAHGARPGPRLSLIAGVHGCEYSSIAAVTRFMNELDTSELSGTVTAVPVVSMESFRQRSAFVVPIDGKNLNRCFPGSYDGTYSDVLARSIFDELIAPADVLIDLHGGDLVEGLEPFTIYQASPVEERARELAVAFGLPYVFRQERSPAGGGGMTCTAAAAARVPAIIAEAGGRGQLETDAVTMLVEVSETCCEKLAC